MEPPDLPHPREPLTLDAVTFDTARYRYLGEEGNQRQWKTPEEDTLVLLLFAKRPNLPENARNAFVLCDQIKHNVCSDTVHLTLFDFLAVDDAPAVLTIIKVLQPPHGAVYIGSWTFPFAEFSYVLKLQCEERGITGVRETALLVKAMNEGKQPDDPDDERYDKLFPDHPLSRLRREIAALYRTIRLDAKVKSAAPFPLPKFLW